MPYLGKPSATFEGAGFRGNHSSTLGLCHSASVRTGIPAAPPFFPLSVVTWMCPGFLSTHWGFLFPPLQALSLHVAFKDGYFSGLGKLPTGYTFSLTCVLSVICRGCSDKVLGPGP